MAVKDLIPDDAPVLVDASTIASWWGVCHQTIRNWADAGQFPPGLRIGPRKRMWDTAALREFIRRKIAEAEATTSSSPVGVS